MYRVGQVQPAADETWPELQQLPEEELERRQDAVFPAVTEKPPKPRDPRLPPPGTKLKRRFEGRGHQVTVTEDAFVYRGQRFGSLTAVATAIAGRPRPGYTFFRLSKPWDEGGGEETRMRDRREWYRRRRERLRRKAATATES